jgi:phage FluMu protein Com
MTELRCSKCHKLLCKHENGLIEIQCPRCKEMNLSVPFSEEALKIRDNAIKNIIAKTMNTTK